MIKIFIACGCGLALPFLASADRVEEAPDANEETQHSQAGDISFFSRGGIGFATDLVVKAGFVIGGGPVATAYTDFLAFEELVFPGDRLSLGAWGAFDVGDDAFHEIDFIGRYSVPMNEDVAISAGFERWEYPSGLVGDYHDVVTAGIDTEHVDLTVLRVLGRGTAHAGTLYLVRWSHFFDALGLTPEVKAVYRDDFILPDSEMSHITPGLSVALDGVPVYVGYQIGISDSVESLGIAGISCAF